MPLARWGARSGATPRSIRSSPGAARVLSNADPKRTFLSLCDRAELPAEFVARIEAYRCMGTSIKINLAVSELPYVRGLPEGGVQPYHTGIMEMNPFIADMDFQQAQAVQGIPADPAHIEVCFPTVHDPSLAPEGKHIMTIDVNSQPYHLRDERWDDIKDGQSPDAIEAKVDEIKADLDKAVELLQG